MKKVFLTTSLTFIMFLTDAQNTYIVQTKEEGKIKKEKELTVEEKFVADNFPFIHMADWKSGMKFMVEQRHSTDPDNPTVASKLDLKPYKKKVNSPFILQKDFQFKIFTVTALEERKVSCPRGQCTRTYIIFECEGEKYEYENSSGSRDEIKNIQNIFAIEKLIYLGDIEKAREILLNKQFYIMDNVSSDFKHEKFVLVTITNVGLGSAQYPVKIIYSTESGEEYSVGVNLSRTNCYSDLHKFQDMFSLENPRLK